MGWRLDKVFNHIVLYILSSKPTGWDGDTGLNGLSLTAKTTVLSPLGGMATRVFPFLLLLLTLV